MTTSESIADERLVTRVRSAPFIFSGKIIKTGASTVAVLEPNEQVVVVAIRTVFRTPPVLGQLEGRRIKGVGS